MIRRARMPVADAALSCVAILAILVGDRAATAAIAGASARAAEALSAPLLRTTDALGAPFAFTGPDIAALGAGTAAALRFLAWIARVAGEGAFGAGRGDRGASRLSRLVAWVVAPALAAAITLSNVEGGRGDERPAPAVAQPPPVRFTDVPLVAFDHLGAPTFVTVADLVAIGSASIVGVRFLAWALGPVLALARGRRGPPRSDA